MDNLATFIVSCDESFAVVERPAFRKLVDYLRPGVDLPSRRQISSHIMGMHTTQRLKLRASVARISSKISFTTDIWTAPNQKSFMAITFHYLTHEFKLTSGLLDFIPMTGSHTGVLIGKAFRECLVDFGICKEKVF